MARLNKIYTRTGDDGTTGLVGGKRVRKNSLRIEAIGAVDELNAAIGLARTLNRQPKLDVILAGIQNDLFHLGAELATPPGKLRAGMPRVGAKQVVALETVIDQYNRKLGPLQEFILPTGPLHLARTVCRRAERACVRMGGAGFVVPYLNRLGDALFVLARLPSKKETYWKK